MTTQTKLFPRTTLELLEELAEVHRADQDKAVKADAAIAELEAERGLRNDLLHASNEELRRDLAKAEAALAERERILRLAAADYWREQMDGLPDDAPVAHIVDATIEKWRVRAEEGSEA